MPAKSNVQVKTLNEVETHTRSWGYEKWIANSDLYCGKLLFILENHGTSLHFHVDKTETMFVVKGEVLLETIDPTTAELMVKKMMEGDSVLITPGTVHRLLAVNCVEAQVVEFSTKHDDSDSFRVKKPVIGGSIII